MKPCLTEAAWCAATRRASIEAVSWGRYASPSGLRSSYYYDERHRCIAVEHVAPDGRRMRLVGSVVAP